MQVFPDHHVNSQGPRSRPLSWEVQMSVRERDVKCQIPQCLGQKAEISRDRNRDCKESEESLLMRLLVPPSLRDFVRVL